MKRKVYAVVMLCGLLLTGCLFMVCFLSPLFGSELPTILYVILLTLIAIDCVSIRNYIRRYKK